MLFVYLELDLSMEKGGGKVLEKFASSIRLQGGYSGIDLLRVYIYLFNLKVFILSRY